jgi:hypothetical protein
MTRSCSGLKPVPSNNPPDNDVHAFLVKSQQKQGYFPQRLSSSFEVFSEFGPTQTAVDLHQRREVAATCRTKCMKHYRMKLPAKKCMKHYRMKLPPAKKCMKSICFLFK